MLRSSHEYLLRRSLRLLQHQHFLKFASTAIICVPSQSPRHFSSSAPLDQDGRDVAILGGGITGLASAYYLSRADPTARITLYEASQRLGGWIQTKHVSVDNARILFESGPRTLRPSGNGLVTAKLLQDLGLKSDIIAVPSFAPASRYRYIYYPNRLNRLPARGDGLIGFLSNVLSNRALYSGIISGFYHEFRNPTQRPSTADESVGHYISRRFNPAIADKLVSAVFHGIYAGDIYRLSVRSLLPLLPYLESRFGSVTMGAAVYMSSQMKSMERRMWEITNEAEMKSIDRDLVGVLSQSSVFMLKDGLGALTARLDEVLKNNERVDIKMLAPISKLEPAREEGGQGRTTSLSSCKVRVSSGAEESSTSHDTVISTLPHQSLAALFPGATTSAVDTRTVPGVSVMVVNLFFKNPNLLASNPGFGYLIPRSVPYDQNPECALGVIFDTFAAPGQDVIHGTERPRLPAIGTKLTVMLGGHWWSSWEDLPSEAEGIVMAQTILARHLGITDEPSEVHATLQRDCIPQYTVGHGQRMQDFHQWLLKEYGGNLKVAGASYGGVGFNDCVRSAWDLGKEVKERGWKGNTTGLDRYASNMGFPDFVDLQMVPGEGWTVKRLQED